MMEIKKCFINNSFLLILLVLSTTLPTVFLLTLLYLRTTTLKPEIISPIPSITESVFEKPPSLLSQTVQEKIEAQASPASQEAVLSPTKEPVTPSEIPESVETFNTPPSSGYRQQPVKTETGIFTVAIVSASLDSTRVIVDTASDSDCHNDCPVLPLASFVSRNNAFAGINGSYFCPADYASCANKKNAFDTLLMNKDKKYFNSENNIYSTVPAVIFSGNSARFVTQSLEWGRDTGVDAVIANQPLLVLDGQLKFRGDDDFKRGVKSNRSFIGTTGNTVYIGVVHNATVAESAQVVYNLGINSALNLDSGWSTALWYQGYKVGPGRNIPNALLLINK